ncbi:MAG: glycosyltransferase, partial [Candidatus Thorarchaeota archaeon]
GGGIREIVHHGTDGLLVEPGSPDALASALTYLIDHPEMVKRMGIAGQEYARDLGKKYLSIQFHVLGRYIGTG